MGTSKRKIPKGHWKMKQLNEKQIQQNWTDLRTIINNTFSGDRLERLNKMYDDFEDRMVVAPASAKKAFHNAMVGGYVEHILHVINMSKQIKDYAISYKK